MISKTVRFFRTLVPAPAPRRESWGRKQDWEQLSLLPAVLWGKRTSVSLGLLGERAVKMALHLVLLHIVANTTFKN